MLRHHQSVKTRIAAALVIGGCCTIGPLYAEQNETDPAATAAKTEECCERPEPKPISETTKRGLKYLISQQHDNGGWGQGGGWRTNAKGGRDQGPNVKDPADVGNTCMAVLALLRAGNTPTSGPYSQELNRAVEFIQASVNKSDTTSIYVTDVRNTQLQSKIGIYVDTFLTGQVLAELKGKMPSAAAEEALAASLSRTIDKIAKNQKSDGTFEGNRGWASVLSQGICSKALNLAKAKGVRVSEEVLARDVKQAQASLIASATPPTATPPTASPTADVTAAAAGRSVGYGYGGALGSAISGAAVGGYGGGYGGGGGYGAGDAGVSLYSLSANTNRANAYGIASKAELKKLKSQLEDKELADADRTRIRQQVRFYEQAEVQQTANVQRLAARAKDSRFIAGFGNNGGEEFLSYMNISESLFVKGGKEWQEWDQSITKAIDGHQNNDGSWSGHHCITGRTFCTSAAILCLLADRTPVPESGEEG